MPMLDPKYVRIKITDIPKEFTLEYDLAGKEDHNGWIYFEIQHGYYRLPQAGILANYLLCWNLEKEDYYEAATTPGLLKHELRPIQFYLIVDNFCMEYVGIKHFNHLRAVLQGYHQVQTNTAGNKITGLNVQQGFPSKWVCIDIKSYANNLLLSLNWPMPKKPQLLPFTATPIAHGQKTQYMPDKDTSSPLLPERIKCIQKIIGSLLCHAQAVHNKLLVALNAISARQAKATVHTEQIVETLINYVTTYPNDGIVYRASDMVLCAHADAGYLNKIWSRSRAGAHIFLLEDNPSIRFNGTVLTIATIIKFVMALLLRLSLLHSLLPPVKWFPTSKPS